MPCILMPRLSDSSKAIALDSYEPQLAATPTARPSTFSLKHRHCVTHLSNATPTRSALLPISRKLLEDEPGKQEEATLRVSVSSVVLLATGVQLTAILLV